MAHRDNAAWKVRTVTAEPGGARFRVKWDKVRSGAAQPRGRIAVLEIQQPTEFGAECVAVWNYVQTQASDTLDELAQGVFTTKKEISDYCDVTPTMAAKYIEQGVRYGLWREDQISRWLAYAKKLRTEGKTTPPVRPDTAWKHEETEVPTEPNGDVRF